MKLKPIGFVVVEWCDDYEQTLGLDQDSDKPAGGVLDWRSDGSPAALFPNRQEARIAIDRTEHYRLAFQTNHPFRKNCKVVPVSAVSVIPKSK